MSGGQIDGEVALLPDLLREMNEQGDGKLLGEMFDSS